MSAPAKEKIIVALDVPNSQEARQLVGELKDVVSWVKVGLQLFVSEGPQIVRDLKAQGFKVFLDLKFHDIPNTTREAIRSAVSLGVDMTTIHLGGGAAMVRAAVDAASGSSTQILGVTVLTSFDEAELKRVGVETPVAGQVERLVSLAMDSGLRGIVCSPLEIEMIRQIHGDKPILVTPGVRPAGAALGDQSRVMTPADAIRQGANYLVIGRPITAASSPREAAQAIAGEIASAL